MVNAAQRSTPVQETRSPLATVAVRSGRLWMGSPICCAAPSEMKLCVEPVSRRAISGTSTTRTRNWRESWARTPATAWRE
uniref:Uncharacterized protein n=1 Tax=Arundo donax TaxID=35708 RepID=A0A0A8YCY7_ARUDO